MKEGTGVNRVPFFVSDHRDVTDRMRSQWKLRVDDVSKSSSRSLSFFSLCISTLAPRSGTACHLENFVLTWPENFTDVGDVTMSYEDGSVSRSMTINLDFSCCLRVFFSASAARHQHSFAR